MIREIEVLKYAHEEKKEGLEVVQVYKPFDFDASLVAIRNIDEEQPNDMYHYVEDGNVVYVLFSDRESFFYIGKSKAPRKRFLMHALGIGSKTTKNLSRLELLMLLDRRSHLDEDVVTLVLRFLFGWKRVRGGRFVFWKPV